MGVADYAFWHSVSFKKKDPPGLPILLTFSAALDYGASCLRLRQMVILSIDRSCRWFSIQFEPVIQPTEGTSLKESRQDWLLPVSCQVETIHMHWYGLVKMHVLHVGFT